MTSVRTYNDFLDDVRCLEPTKAMDHITDSEEDGKYSAEGTLLTPEQARLLESRLISEPFNIACRLRLLGFYRKGRSSADIKLWCEHTEWMVKNFPGLWSSGNLLGPAELTPKQFLQIRNAWIEQVDSHPYDPIVLSNAASSISSRDFESAELWFKRAIAIQPKEPDILRKLTYLYARESQVGALKQRRRCAYLAFDVGRQAAKLQAHRGKKFSLLARLCRLALEFENLAFAESCIRQMMSISKEMNVWLDTAYNFAGLAAIRRGRVAAAKRALNGIAALGFYRDFSLASELLELGEREAVMHYLKKILPKSGVYQGQLQEWIKELTEGRTPVLSKLPVKLS